MIPAPASAAAGDPRAGWRQYLSSLRSAPRARDAMAVMALLALVLALFKEPVFGGRALYDRDIFLYWHAQVETAVRALAAGSWPVWDPHASFGEPLWEFPTGLLYPTAWLNLVMPPWHYYTLATVLHLSLAGAGMYALARGLRISRAGALTGAALWVTSGPVLSVVNMMNLLAGTAWLPWSFFAAHRALRSLKASDAVFWGATLAAAMLAGAETVFMAGLGTAAWALGEALRPRRRRELPRLLGCGVLALVFALGLSAGGWLPYAQLAARTARQGLPWEVRTHWSVGPWGLLQLVLPVFPRELPMRFEASPELAEMASPYLYSLYLGLPCLTLAAAGLSARARWRGRFFAALGLVGLLFSLGRHAFAHDAIVALLPPLRSVRFPMKGMVLAAFCACVLAALGFDAWRRSRSRLLPSLGTAALGLGLATAGVALTADGAPALAPWLAPWPGAAAALTALEWRLGLSAFLAVTLLALALARRLPRAAPAGAVTIALLGVADLVHVHRGLNPTAPRELFTYRPPTFELIRSDGGTRVYFKSRTVRGSEGGGATAPSAPAGMSRAVAMAFTMKLYLLSPALRILGLSSSYEEDVKGAHPAFLVSLSNLFRASVGTPGYLRLLQIGAVSHVVALDTEGTDALRRRATFTSLFGDPVLVYRVPGALPRCSVVPGVRVADGTQALAILLQADFDPTRELVLAEGVAGPGPAPFHGAVRECRIAHDRVGADVELSDPGHLLIVDTFDPNWRAEVDGVRAPVLRANVAFRAVPVPSGRHRVVMRYRPPSIAVGLAVMTVAVATALLVLSRAWRAGG